MSGQGGGGDVTIEVVQAVERGERAQDDAGPATPPATGHATPVPAPRARDTAGIPHRDAIGWSTCRSCWVGFAGAFAAGLVTARPLASSRSFRIDCTCFSRRATRCCAWAAWVRRDSASRIHRLQLGAEALHVPAALAPLGPEHRDEHHQEQRGDDEGPGPAGADELRLDADPAPPRPCRITAPQNHGAESSTAGERSARGLLDSETWSPDCSPGSSTRVTRSAFGDLALDDAPAARLHHRPPHALRAHRGAGRRRRRARPAARHRGGRPAGDPAGLGVGGPALRSRARSARCAATSATTRCS